MYQENHDSLAQPSPYRVVPTIATADTGPAELPADLAPENLQCPFCLEGGFDKIGLKGHLENNCEAYAAIEPPRRLFS